jgi:hypothetical protein
VIKLVAAITPEEIKKSREAAALNDLELINKVVTTISNRLEGLDEGRDLVFSFTGEGLPFTILDIIAKTFDDAGWDVTIYGQDRARDTGLKISWKMPDLSTLSKRDRAKWEKKTR